MDDFASNMHTSPNTKVPSKESRMKGGVAQGAIALFVASSICVLAILSGCSSSSNDQPESNASTIELVTADLDGKKIEVTNHGFSYDNNSFDYAFVFDNPEDAYLANGVMMNVTAYDSAGNELLSETQTFSGVIPNIPYVGCGTVTSNDLAVSRIEVMPVLDNATWVAFDATREQANSIFVIEDQSAQDNILQIVGEVEENRTLLESIFGPDSVPSIEVLAIFYDVDGNVIAGSSSGELDPSVQSHKAAQPAEGEYLSSAFTIDVPAGIQYSSYELLARPAQSAA